MDPAAPLFFGVLVTLVSAPLLYAGVRKRRRVSRLRARGPVSVRELPARSDPVWVEGTATTSGETVRAPLTDTSCLAYEYEIEERPREVEAVEGWSTVESGSDHAQLVVDDGTGSVLVDFDRANLELDAERHTRLPDGRDMPDSIESYAEDCDAVTTVEKIGFYPTEYDHRFTERRIEPGETIHVYGEVERAPAEAVHDGHVDAFRTGGSGSFIISDSRELLSSPAIGGGKTTATVLGGLFFAVGAGLLGYGSWLLL